MSHIPTTALWNSQFKNKENPVFFFFFYPCVYDLSLTRIALWSVAGRSLGPLQTAGVSGSPAEGSPALYSGHLTESEV